MLRRSILTCALVALVVPFSLTTTPAAAPIDDMVNGLSRSSYQDFLDTQLYATGSYRRTWQSTGSPRLPRAEHDWARDNIRNRFASLGLQTSLDAFTFTYNGVPYAGANNVLGLLPGRAHAERVYVIGAHYDSVYAGADDNGSGAAAVVEAARVLSQYTFDSSILFAAWDAEEFGLLGSRHWVNTFDESQVYGVVNLDMIAYNHDADHDGRGDNKATFYGVATWSQQWQALQTQYAPDISTTIYTPNMSQSDHWPFQLAGRPASGLIEDVWNGGALANPYYHTVNDSISTPGYIDYEYAVKLLRGGVALTAQEAQVVPEPAGAACMLVLLVLVTRRTRFRPLT